jgi:hypothetical protein
MGTNKQKRVDKEKQDEKAAHFAIGDIAFRVKGLLSLKQLEFGDYKHYVMDIADIVFDLKGDISGANVSHYLETREQIETKGNAVEDVEWEIFNGGQRDE